MELWFSGPPAASDRAGRPGRPASERSRYMRRLIARLVRETAGLRYRTGRGVFRLDEKWVAERRDVN